MPLLSSYTLASMALSVASASAPFRKKHNAFHHIVVIDDAAIGAMDGFAVPAEADSSGPAQRRLYREREWAYRCES